MRGERSHCIQTSAETCARRHWLVWTLLPLVDWSKAAPFVSERGISGRVCPHSQDASTTIKAEGNSSEPVCEEIVAFAKQQWPDASEIFWIVNPVALQTVPGLVCGERLRKSLLDYLCANT